MMRSFILGTDWWTDCDDAVALRLITQFVKAGKARLLGVGINACMEYSVASVKGFLKADGITDIPLGLDEKAIDFGGAPPYQRRLAEDFGKGASNAEAEDAVRLYRRLLANANEPIEIIEIGYLQVITAVLQSGADDISAKTGLELISEKVSKIWVMAGKWDADGEKENNFARNERSRRAGKIFCEICPVPVTFLGWEVGYDVITGSCLDESDHLYRVLCDHGSKNGRSSWDPMLVLMALIGDERKAHYELVKGRASVDEESGCNYFARDNGGAHAFVVKTEGDEFYEKQINSIISQSASELNFE